MGVGTNVDFCRHVLAQPQVRAGELDTELLDRLVVDYSAPAPTPAALVAGALGTLDLGSTDDVWSSAVAFRIGVPSPIVTRLVCDGQRYTVSALVADPETGQVPAPGAPRTLNADVTVSRDGTPDEEGAQLWRGAVYLKPRGEHAVTVRCDGIGSRWVVQQTSGAHRWVCGEDGTWVMGLAHTLASSDDAATAGDVHSPMPGTVVAVPGTDGGSVDAGEALVVVEAMKMEHTLRAPVAGIAQISVRAGQKVDAQQVLAHVVDPTDEKN